MWGWALWGEEHKVHSHFRINIEGSCVVWRIYYFPPKTREKPSNENLAADTGRHNQTWINLFVNNLPCFSWTSCWKPTSPRYEPWRRCSGGCLACQLRSSCVSSWTTRWAAPQRSFTAKLSRGYMETRPTTSSTGSRKTQLCLSP